MFVVKLCEFVYVYKFYYYSVMYTSFIIIIIIVLIKMGKRCTPLKLSYN